MLRTFGRIISANCRQRRNLFIPNFQYITTDGWRSVQYIKAKRGTSEGRRLLFLTDFANRGSW
jgi:hypothetical protein